MWVKEIAFCSSCSGTATEQLTIGSGGLSTFRKIPLLAIGAKWKGWCTTTTKSWASTCQQKRESTEVADIAWTIEMSKTKYRIIATEWLGDNKVIRKFLRGIYNLGTFVERSPDSTVYKNRQSPCCTVRYVWFRMNLNYRLCASCLVRSYGKTLNYLCQALWSVWNAPKL